MGFFSWECKHCGKEILAPYPSTKWSMAVAIDEEDRFTIGQYDGYGRISDVDICDDGNEVEMYHEHCWEEVGSPEKFSSPSEYAINQGFFFTKEELERDYPIDGGWKGLFTLDCQKCRGLGYVFREEATNEIEDCDSCNGMGYVQDE